MDGVDDGNDVEGEEVWIDVWNDGDDDGDDDDDDDDDDDVDDVDDEGGNNGEENEGDVNEDEDDGDEDADAVDDLFHDPAVKERICNGAMAILLNRLNFPSPQRDRAIVRFAQQFINNVKEDIHKTITDTRLIEEGYDGLDSERDTEKEVETAIRCCPEVFNTKR